jgi:N-acetyl sugar amidotransferase
MDKIAYPSEVDYVKFNKDGENGVAKYGLPSKVSFCRTCVISNQRPNSAIEHKHHCKSEKSTIQFNDDKICDACVFSKKKKSEIDWAEREFELKKLCDKYRSRNSSYDCLVPGSGGKDSFYAAHMLKYKYDMNPLTITWAPHIYTSWGWKNLQRWIHAGFDNYLITPNGLVHRLLTRLATEKLFHPFQPFIFGQKNMTPRIAAKLKIPLVFYGESEAEYGNPLNETNNAIRKWKYFSESSDDEIFISGVPLSQLKENYGLKESDLELYFPSNLNDILRESVEVHYLGYYLHWHPQSCFYYAVEHGNFEPAPERTPGTYSKYSGIDDKVDDFHFYTTGVKYGIGRATYDAAQEIRSGDINRDEGVALVKKFDHEFPERFSSEIFDYLSITSSEFPKASRMFEQPIMDRCYFELLANNFRSPHLWKYDQGWRLRHPVWQPDILGYEKV